MKYRITPKKESIKSEIVIDLFPDRICNFKCSYCFVEFTNVFDGAKNGGRFDPDGFDVLLDNIPHDSNILFHILGGEPTLIPSILYITQRILDTKNRVCIVTNGSMLHKLQFQDDVHLEVSLHDEYIDEAYIENIVNGIQNNANCDGIELSVNISQSYDNIKDKIKRVVDRLLSLNQSNFCIKLNPIICVNPDDNHEVDYAEVIEFLGICDNMGEDDGEYILTNLHTKEEKHVSFLEHIDIYDKKGHSFKGCFCMTNTYEVCNNFDLYNACDMTHKIGNILKDPSILRNISSKFMICPNEHCNVGCYMDAIKTFDLDEEL